MHDPLGIVGRNIWQIVSPYVLAGLLLSLTSSSLGLVVSAIAMFQLGHYIHSAGCLVGLVLMQFIGIAAIALWPDYTLMFVKRR